MTVTLQSFRYRNDRDTATIIVEQYQDKGARAPFWRIAYKYDAYPCGITLKGGLKKKPGRGAILAACASI